MKKIVTALVVACMMGTMVPTVYGAEPAAPPAAEETALFADMPRDWSAEALGKAVNNGLLKGYEENGMKLIKPGNLIRRAELAAVLARAFGAEKEADLSNVKDVPQGAWYRSPVAVAVEMKVLSEAEFLRPEDPVTREEAFTMLARAFLIPLEPDQETLSRFDDHGQVSSWASGSLSALVKKEYLKGYAGRLNPKGLLTRAEFAKAMDNLASQYITRPGTVTKTEPGNIVVRVPGVTFSGVTIKGNLILGDMVEPSSTAWGEATVTGDVLSRKYNRKENSVATLPADRPTGGSLPGGAGGSGGSGGGAGGSGGGSQGTVENPMFPATILVQEKTRIYDIGYASYLLVVLKEGTLSDYAFAVDGAPVVLSPVNDENTAGKWEIETLNHQKLKVTRLADGKEGEFPLKNK